MHYSRIISFVALSFLFTQCSEPETSKQFSGVEPQLWELFSLFEQEAQLRGLNYDIEALGITAVIEEIPREHVAGSCFFGQLVQNHITIDRTFWRNSSPLQREMVVFHELGHCALLRGHDESILANGTCGSIMRSGLGSCRDFYTSSSRDYLIDELFE
jgi:hypothetical protein